MVITLEMEMILLSPETRKFFSDQSIKTTGPILWKSIHQNIKDSRSTKHFRTQLKCHYLSNYH